MADESGRTQLNISPSQETMRKLAEAVERYGNRHKNAKNRNTAAADILDKFVDVWLHLIEKQEEQLQQQINALTGNVPLKYLKLFFLFFLLAFYSEV